VRLDRDGVSKVRCKAGRDVRGNPTSTTRAMMASHATGVFAATAAAAATDHSDVTAGSGGNSVRNSG
jgi:hypothetical protein